MIIFIFILSMFSNSKELQNKHLVNHENSNYFENIVINSKNNIVMNLNGFNYSYENINSFFKNINIKNTKNKNEKYIFKKEISNIELNKKKLFKVYNIFGVELNSYEQKNLDNGLYIKVYIQNNKFVSEKIKIE